jgi:hypothetical protein
VFLQENNSYTEGKSCSIAIIAAGRIPLSCTQAINCVFLLNFPDLPGQGRWKELADGRAMGSRACVKAIAFRWLYFRAGAGPISYGE